MTTPTNPMKHAPSQQSHTQGRTPSGFPAATPPVSTPFSLSQAAAAFSPRGPKSSPQQFKKSPANSATLMGHPSNAPLSFDSPSAAAAMGALGLGNGLDMGLDSVGVGGIHGLGGLSREDERIKRLDAIIDVVKQSKGMVSEAGLERLSQRTGLNKMWEDHRTPDGRTTKTLVIAGHGLQLDINIDNNIVQSVTLAFPESESAPNVTKHIDKAGKILLEDLQLASGQSPLTKTLDKFAANLERLAVLDKLSIFPGLDCQEAIAGLSESLEQLNRWEISKLREDTKFGGKSDREVEIAAMCSRSGRPGMHMRDQVGLSLDYWVERRLSLAADLQIEEARKTWAILIGCKSLDEGELYPSIRITDKWISPSIEKADPGPEDLLGESNGPVLDWLEPDPTTLPQSADSKNAGVDMVQPDGTTQKLPNVKFVATFSPPVVVPQSVAHTFYGLTNSQPPPMLLPGNTFDGISFPLPEGSTHDASELRTIPCQRNVAVMGKNGEMVTKRHDTTLFVYKPVYGQTIKELSFSHPRQLVTMLPTLRQYALISTLLERSFGSNIAGEESGMSDHESIETRRTITREEDYHTFMMERKLSDSSGTDDKPLRLDVVLSVHPTASLNVVFPFRDSTANVDLQIQQNGVIHIVSQNIILEDQSTSEGDVSMDDGKDTKKPRMKPEDLGTLLEIFEDLCQWAEWIRMNLS